jgi:Flp pilus assembly protein TadG
VDSATGPAGCRPAAATDQFPPIAKLARWVHRGMLLGPARAGSSAVEFALATPVLLGLLVPLVDLGMVYSRQIQVEQAAQAGAQYASVHPWNSNSVSAISNAVTAAGALPGITASPPPNQICGCPSGSAVLSYNCNTTCPNGQSAGYYVIVNAELPYTPALPYSVLGNSLTLSAQTTIRIH